MNFKEKLAANLSVSKHGTGFWKLFSGQHENLHKSKMIFVKLNIHYVSKRVSLACRTRTLSLRYSLTARTVVRVFKMVT